VPIFIDRGAPIAYKTTNSALAGLATCDDVGQDSLIADDADLFVVDFNLRDDEHIPGARFVEFPGIDHIFYVGDNANEIADTIEEFLTSSRPPVLVDRVLATVLFTDIVGSTESRGPRRSPLARSPGQSPRHDPAQCRALSRS
jgi:hypothetical protein